MSATGIKRFDINSSELYYHSLYHHIAHWGAYVAMMGVLLTIGFFLSLTPMKDTSLFSVRTGVVVFSICASFLASLYFIGGMNTYGKEKNTRLPEAHLQVTQNFRHETTILLGRLAAGIVFSLDLFLLFCLPLGSNTLL